MTSLGRAAQRNAPPAFPRAPRREPVCHGFVGVEPAVGWIERNFAFGDLGRTRVGFACRSGRPVGRFVYEDHGPFIKWPRLTIHQGMEQRVEIYLWTGRFGVSEPTNLARELPSP